MKNVFIINGHQWYPFSEGKLNASFTEKAANFFVNNGYEVRTTTMSRDHDVSEEIEASITKNFPDTEAIVHIDPKSLYESKPREGFSETWQNDHLAVTTLTVLGQNT